MESSLAACSSKFSSTSSLTASDSTSRQILAAYSESTALPNPHRAAIPPVKTFYLFRQLLTILYALCVFVAFSPFSDTLFLLPFFAITSNSFVDFSFSLFPFSFIRLPAPYSLL
jgi:hypothetical protein